MTHRTESAHKEGSTMMRRLKGSAAILVGLVLLAMTSSAWAQSPVAATDTGAAAQLVATKVITPTEQKAALAFWSREAMAAAQPLALPVQVGPAAVDQAAPADSAAIGRPGFVAAGVAAKGSERALRAAYPN